VPGKDVDDVHEPARETPELLIAQTNSPVYDCFWCGGQVAGQFPDPLRADAGDVGDPFRWVVGRDAAHHIDAVDVRGRRPE
jgi:hypothetical protein